MNNAKATPNENFKVKLCKGLLALLLAFFMFLVTCKNNSIIASASITDPYTLRFEVIFNDIDISNSALGFLNDDSQFFYCTDKSGVSYKLDLVNMTKEEISSVPSGVGNMSSPNVKSESPIPLSDTAKQNALTQCKVAEGSKTHLSFLYTDNGVSFYRMEEVPAEAFGSFDYCYYIINSNGDKIEGPFGDFDVNQTIYMYNRFIMRSGSELYTKDFKHVANIPNRPNSHKDGEASYQLETFKNGLSFCAPRFFCDMDGRSFVATVPKGVPTPVTKIIGSDFADGVYLGKGHMYYTDFVGAQRVLCRITFAYGEKLPDEPVGPAVTNQPNPDDNVQNNIDDNNPGDQGNVEQPIAASPDTVEASPAEDSPSEESPADDSVTDDSMGYDSTGSGLTNNADDASNDTAKKFNPFWILVGALVVVLIAIGVNVYLFFYYKKHGVIPWWMRFNKTYEISEDALQDTLSDNSKEKK